MFPTTRRRGARYAIVVARFNEAVTTRLLDGARAALAERGIEPDTVDVTWVSGAWELPVVVKAFVAGHRCEAAIALGAVIRGETPHFDYVAGEAARGLMAVQVEHGVPVGFGLLTCDTLAQAMERAGGAAGNKGYDAAIAALDAAARIAVLDGRTEG
jgi:6,7-dimethyl-8-ribityllumazine synthase